MSQKIALVVTSTGIKNKNSIKDLNLYLAPTEIIFDNGESYKDIVELTHEEFYQKVRSGIFPKTSLPNPGDLEALFKDLLTKYDHVIYMTLGASLSGTYQSGKLLAESVDAERITVYDTETVAVVESFMHEQACKMIKSGKSVKEIIAALDELKKKWKLYFVVEDLKYLQKNGRIGKAAGFVAGILNIKPILKLTREGVDAFEKVRTFKKAIARVIEEIKNADLSKDDPIYIIHGDEKAEAQKVADKIAEIYPENKIEVVLLTPTIGSHAGPGVIGISWFKL